VIIDFQAVKRLVSMGDVLALLGWSALQAQKGELRGRCPIHRSKSAKSRSFACNDRGFTCFSCGEHGDQVRLWALCRGLTLYNAAVDLCRELAVSVPELPKRRSPAPPAAQGTEKRNGFNAAVPGDGSPICAESADEEEVDHD